MDGMDTASGLPVVPGYAVSRLLGRGAGSEVWAAVEEATGDAVAVKLADPTASPSGQLRSLAAREIAVLDRVSSDHVLRLRETVILPSGAVALVLDLAEGGSLAALVAARGRLADGEVVTICTALATTLASLHEAGVIHGDLAAANVLFTSDGKPLLADFAAARLIGESDPPLVAGTAGFVAPEVARGDIPTEASDAYGLGALAWFALTGHPPTAEKGPSLAEAVGFLGRRLGPVVAPLLAVDPSSRPGLRAAAADFYRATTAVPVSLPGEAVDPAAALTRRIRAQAQEAEVAPSRLGPSGSSVRRSGWMRPAALRALRRPALVLAALLGATVVVLAVGRVPALLALPPPAPAVASSGGTSPPDDLGALSGFGAPTAPTSAPPATAPSGPSPVEALRASPGAVLTALADARAAALVSADPSQLLRASAPDSPVHRSDAALLSTLTGSQTRYADLAFFVRVAEVQDGTSDGEARVRAVIDRSSYRVLGPGSREQTVPAAAGVSYVYRLLLVDGQWRLAEVA